MSHDATSHRRQVLGSLLVAALIAAVTIAVVAARLPAVSTGFPEYEEAREDRAEAEEEAREERAEAEEEAREDRAED